MATKNRIDAQNITPTAGHYVQAHVHTAECSGHLGKCSEDAVEPREAPASSPAAHGGGPRGPGAAGKARRVANPGSCCACACSHVCIWHCDRIAHARNRAAATAAQPPPRVRAHPPGARVRRKKRAGIPTSRLKVFEIITHSTDQAHAGIRAHEPSESM